MKYLKKFEIKKDTKCYWLLPTDDRFESALQKIGCDIYYRSIFLQNDRLR